MNETGKPFPDWVPESAHHALYDCLYCQMVCPMNKDHIYKLGNDVVFTEEEVAILLKRIHFDKYPDELKRKSKYLGLDQWPDGIAKNIKTLIEIADNNVK